ncbi:threonine synthase [Candidatus Bathyarchaeota archaeon]|nr:threonine synthase [Candidatus Bathyarchaeota archaeon]
MTYYFECINCGESYSEDEILYLCRKCGDLLDIKYRFHEVPLDLPKNQKWLETPPSVWKYRFLLPISKNSKIISLNEGGTTLYKCDRLGEALGLANLYVKNEGENPTGSFKDRGMTVGVTKALELGINTVICASTGNTSASLAAYAAKADLGCVILIPAGKIAYGKLAQAMIYGAQVIQIRGNFDDALKIVLALSEQYRKFYLLNSINPYRLEGQKTLGFEICEQLNYVVPDKVVVPVGNAGNISAIWKGFTEFRQLNLIDSTPQMVGIQAEGAAPIATAIASGKTEISPVAHPDTIATAIRIGSPVSWKKAMKTIRESKGTAQTVTDSEIIEAQKLLARKEGLFVEPAGASSLAGVKKLVESGEVRQDETIVCIATGHGLKDPDTAIQICEKPIEVDADLKALKAVLDI